MQDGGALLNHGLIDKQAQSLGKARGTIGGEKLQNGAQKFRVKMVGHVCVFVGCVCCTPTGNHTDQPPTNFAQAPSGAGCAQLAVLAIAPPPPEGAASSQRTQLQNKLYTGWKEPRHSIQFQTSAGILSSSSNLPLFLATKKYQCPQTLQRRLTSLDF